MERTVIMLGVASACALLFAGYNACCVLLRKNRMVSVTGTVVSIVTALPETSKARNSKWAIVSYKVNGKRYTSCNRIQVPMTAQVGSKVKICYDKDAPEKLFSFSVKWIVVSLLIAAVCVIAIVVQEYV